MKDLMGAALLGELLGQLARNANLRAALESVKPEEAERVLVRLIGEIERSARVLASPLDSRTRTSQPSPSLAVPTIPPPIPQGTIAVPSPPNLEKLQTSGTPVRQGARTGDRTSALHPSDPGAGNRPDEGTPGSAVQQSAVVQATESPNAVPSGKNPERVPASATTPRTARATGSKADAAEREQERSARAQIHPIVPPRPITAHPATEPAARQRPAESHAARTPVVFDEDRAYVLAASLVGMQDTPSPEPFAIDEDGLEEGTSVFALDHAGMRFYLSHVKSPEASVSKSGMLLLGKAESLRHRGQHERLVNRLRVRATLLPAESGTVVRGRDDLMRRVDFRLHALLEILLGLAKVSTWRLTASVLDQRVLQVLPAESTSTRSASYE